MTHLFSLISEYVLHRRCIFVSLAVLFAAMFPIPNNADAITYGYNDSRELVRVQYEDGTIIDYLYDGAGNRIAQTISLPGAPTNNPPYPPENIDPPDLSTAVGLSTTLSWNGYGDPDTGDVVFFNIYFGTISPPPL